MMPSQDMTWTTVTLKPGIDVKAGETYENIMSACGRVLVSVGPDSAQVYRRNRDGDYELTNIVDLT